MNRPEPEKPVVKAPPTPGNHCPAGSRGHLGGNRQELPRGPRRGGSQGFRKSRERIPAFSSRTRRCRNPPALGRAWRRCWRRFSMAGPRMPGGSPARHSTTSDPCRKEPTRSAETWSSTLEKLGGLHPIAEPKPDSPTGGASNVISAMLAGLKDWEQGMPGPAAACFNAVVSAKLAAGRPMGRDLSETGGGLPRGPPTPFQSAFHQDAFHQSGVRGGHRRTELRPGHAENPRPLPLQCACLATRPHENGEADGCSATASSRAAGTARKIPHRSGGCPRAVERIFE